MGTTYSHCETVAQCCRLTKMCSSRMKLSVKHFFCTERDHQMCLASILVSDQFGLWNTASILQMKIQEKIRSHLDKWFTISTTTTYKYKA